MLWILTRGRPQDLMKALLQAFESSRRLLNGLLLAGYSYVLILALVEFGVVNPFDFRIATTFTPAASNLQLI